MEVEVLEADLNLIPDDKVSNETPKTSSKSKQK
jgi:hypothetical protein